MKKNRRLVVSLAVIFCVVISFVFFFNGKKSETSIQKKEQELGKVINDLKNGDTYIVSHFTHEYLFDRLPNKDNSSLSTGKMELGTLSYNISEISDGYVLTSNFESASNQYHLILEKKVAASLKTDQFSEILLVIKKQAGAYGNK